MDEITIKVSTLYKLATCILVVALVAIFFYGDTKSTSNVVAEEPNILEHINDSVIIENWEEAINEEIQKVENGNSYLDNLAINIKTNFKSRLNLSEEDYSELFYNYPIMDELAWNTTLTIEEIIISQRNNNYIPSIQPDVELPNTDFPDLPSVPEMPDIQIPEVPNFDSQSALRNMPRIPNF